MQRIAAGDAELARRLLAYADERLSPDEAAAARMRARVMREARVVLEARLAPAAEPTPIRRRTVAPGLRRAASLVLAAALSLVAVGGAALAASPGGPLYGAALWVEELTLPSGGEARVAADLGRLERRLEEAVRAANSGNQGAVQAALAAYREAVEHAMGAAGANADWLARLEAALEHHQTVLQGVLGMVPDQAKDAIQQAIEKSGNAMDRIGDPGGPSGPGGPGGPGQQGPDPDKTPKPADQDAEARPDAACQSGPHPPTGPHAAGRATAPVAGAGRRKRLAPSAAARSRTLRSAGDVKAGPTLELIVLGAGPAYTDRRGSTGAAYLVRAGEAAILLDLGQGSFPALTAELEPSRLLGIVVSHLHADHFIDLIPLRHYLRYEFQPPRRVAVLGPRGLADRIDALLDEPGFTAATLDVGEIGEGPTRLGPFEITSRLVTHTAESYAFRVARSGGGRGLVYSGDCGRASDLAPLIRRGDALLTEISFGAGPVPEGALHLDGPAIGELARDSAPARVLLTHLQMGFDEIETIASVRAQFDGLVELVKPGFRTAI